MNRPILDYKPERLQKLLSAHAVASRRKAEKMITDGRVYVNGVKAILGQSAQYGCDDIMVDGIPLAAKSEPVCIMLNKPRGYITTVIDDRGRKTVMDIITGVGMHVYPIGRLDADSEGLLLFTNDGEFANAVMHPSNKKRKTYEVEVSGNIDAALGLLRQPVKIENRIVTAENVEFIGTNSGGKILKITIIEGRNRQVRKMCSSCGLRVKSLKRVSIGSLNLGNLKTGQWRYLTKDEAASLSV